MAADCSANCSLPCRPLPSCALGVFVHVEKTGGTSIRVWLRDQPGFEYVEGGRLSLAEVAQYPGAFLRAHPRVVFELHGSLPEETWAHLRTIRRAPSFAAAGCRLISFVVVREPVAYLRSNLHDSFLHSPFKARFRELLRRGDPYADGGGGGDPELFYHSPRWHAAFPSWAHELADLQTRTLLPYVVPHARKREAFRHQGNLSAAAGLAARFLARFDIVATTERMPALFARLMRAFGLQSPWFDVVAATSTKTAQLLRAHPQWGRSEDPALRAAANASKSDAQVYEHAMQLEAAQIRRLAGGARTFDCQVASLQALNVHHRVYTRQQMAHRWKQQVLRPRQRLAKAEAKLKAAVEKETALSIGAAAAAAPAIDPTEAARRAAQAQLRQQQGRQRAEQLREVSLAAMQGAGAASSLAPRAMWALPAGSVVPTGWLLDQLLIQARGLSGHLPREWAKLTRSSWVGGDQIQEEVLPYVLRGIVPLYALLRSAARARAHPRRAARREVAYWAMRLENDSHAYFDAILTRQATDGWLGPPQQPGDGIAYWPRSPMLLAMAEYAEAAEDDQLARRVQVAMRRYAHCLHERILHTPLDSWAMERAADLALPLFWLLDHAAVEAEAARELLAVSRMLIAQSVDWELWFDARFSRAEYVRRSKRREGRLSHNVNVAMALKTAAVRWRLERNESLRAASRERMGLLDRHAGQPTGAFGGDEEVGEARAKPEAAEADSPSRGVELCQIVEAMTSHHEIFSAFAEVASLDRLERLAFNALPAAWFSPAGGDMVAHSYLSPANHIDAAQHDQAAPTVFSTTGAFQGTFYGLEPINPCCTANFHQGFPQLASSIFWRSNDGGVAIGVLAPAQVDLSLGDRSRVSIMVSDGEDEAPAAGRRRRPRRRRLRRERGADAGGGPRGYPWSDSVHISAMVDRAAPMPLYVRVPGWAGLGSSLRLSYPSADGRAGKSPSRVVSLAGRNGSLVRLEVSRRLHLTLTFEAAVRLERWSSSAGAVSVHRGPLLFSLPLVAEAALLRRHGSCFVDYAATSTTEWRYALANSAADMSFSRHDPLSHTPFNHSAVPCSVRATARALPSWGVRHRAPLMPPAGAPCSVLGACGPVQSVELVPHGATALRIALFPTYDHAGE